MFGFGKAFRGRSYYVFNYTPRYYDERKERLQKLEEKYAHTDKKVRTDEDDVTITFSRDHLKNAWRKSKKTSADTKSTRRLALIITILVGIVAYLFELHKLI